METKNVAWEDLMEEKNLSIEELPEELQQKIKQYDDCYDEYLDLDDTDSQILELEVKLTALDDGICSDLTGYCLNKEKIQKEKEEEEKLAQQQAQQQASAQPQGGEPQGGEPQGGQGNFGDGGKTSSSRPSWRFW